MDYVVEGLDPAPFAPLFGLGDAALAERGAVRIIADHTPGYREVAMWNGYWHKTVNCHRYPLPPYSLH